MNASSTSAIFLMTGSPLLVFPSPSVIGMMSRLAPISRLEWDKTKEFELQPEVTLLDVVTPVMKGEDVLGQLKADPSTEDIPVVVVTSKPLQPSASESLNEKAVAILSKTALSRPEGPPLLREALQRAGWDVFLQTARS